MKATEPGTGRHRRNRRRLTFHRSSIGRVLIQKIVYPIIVMVVHVVANQPSQMYFVQRDDVVEDLPPTTADPAFRDPILPGRLHTRALRLEAGGLQESDHIGIEFRVVVQDDISIRTSLGERFPELLHDPIGGGMGSDIDVQDLAPPVPDHEEAVQQPEGQGGYGKEIHGDDGLPVIGEEREPALSRIAAARPQASKIPSDRAFGDLEAEFKQFPVDLRRSPVRILFRYATDESSNLFTHLRSAAAGSGSPAPVQAKAFPMPCDHRFRSYNDQNIRPARPHAPQRGPEETVEAVQRRSGPVALEHGDLLSQSEDFKRDIQAAEEEHTQGGEDCGNEIEHESHL